MRAQRKMEWRSPLKAKPLRYPGQSVDDAIQDLVLDSGLGYFMAGVAFVLIALIDWINYLSPSSRSPWLATTMALGYAVFFGLRLPGLRRKVQAMKQGRDGERAVGQYLETTFHPKGYRVFHDIKTDRANVDHVVISPQGIYLIETKTYSKPAKGKPRVHFDGQQIRIMDRKPSSDCVQQVTGLRGWLRDMLHESTGRHYPVKGVVVFPGWFVESNRKANSGDVWVLNPKALPAFIDHQPEVLKPEDVHLAAYHLARHIRTSR